MSECSVAEVLETLASARFHFQEEAELQAGIAQVLPTARREVRLNEKDRIDFLLDGIGIEVKTDGATSDVMRQLHRYANSGDISALILVTNRARHRNVPNCIDGKPVHVFFLGGAL